MKKAVSAFLLLALCLAFFCVLPAQAAEGYGNLRRIKTYSDGVFSDVSPDAWYRDSVAAVYDLGLMEGNGGVFGAMTLKNEVVFIDRDDKRPQRASI